MDCMQVWLSDRLTNIPGGENKSINSNKSYYVKPTEVWMVLDKKRPRLLWEQSSATPSQSGKVLVIKTEEQKSPGLYHTILGKSEM